VDRGVLHTLVAKTYFEMMVSYVNEYDYETTGMKRGLKMSSRFLAWGALRSGGGADKGKHCANLGHKQDDESGLVYMRARYYEPTSGRFVTDGTSSRTAATIQLMELIVVESTLKLSLMVSNSFLISQVA
jgi:RHS repeat-associated protein